MPGLETEDDAVADFQRLLDPSSRTDPYPLLDRLRAASPFVARPGVVVVGRHADCWQVLRSPVVSSERGRARLATSPHGPRTRNFLHLDPPDHTRLRRLVSKAFTPRVVNALAPSVQATVDGLLSAAAARGGLDVVADLAQPLPVHVICELLGVPVADYPVFHEWSTTITHTLEPPIPGVIDQYVTAEARRAARELVRYFRDLIAARRAEPRADLVSYLVEVNEGGDQLTDSELLATCALLLTGGHETAVSMISNGVLALLRHPEQYAALVDDPSLAGGAVEEILRYDPSVQVTARVATEPFQLGKIEVVEGDLLLLLLAAANRDPDVFPDPDRFDIRRGATNHLAFAAGPHFCLGASLARLEGTLAFQTLVRRVRRPRLGAEPAYRPNLNLRGPVRLDVGYDEILPA
ncbi:MAG: cytochrome P450 [Micromonosporaceae bacterium]